MDSDEMDFEESPNGKLGEFAEDTSEDNSDFSEVDQKDGHKRRKRTARPYPSISFQEALELAEAIQRFAAGKKVRRVILLDHLGKTETTSATRNWILDAKKYGLTVGGIDSEYLALTDNGYKASAEELPFRDRLQARVQLAIFNVIPFKALYDEYAGDKLPLVQVLSDSLRRNSIDENIIDQLVNLFLVNLKFLGMLKTVAGAERILTVEHLLEELSDTSVAIMGVKVTPIIDNASSVPQTLPKSEIISANDPSQHFEQVCFYVTSIGETGTEIRQHSDLFLEHLVKPALTSFGLIVIRADQIDRPGIITKQIIDYLLKSKLVIVDLSYHNPNVFYELALRHMMRLPTVQIMRLADSIPFDINQSRTIRIDTTSIYTLVPKLETYRAEISTQVKRALENPDSVDNPVTSAYSGLRVTLS